jgi:hypothetical protein
VKKDWDPEEPESEEMKNWRLRASRPLESSKLSKFEGTWWEPWKEGILAALEESGLTDLVLYDLNPPPVNETEKFAKWTTANRMVRRFLFNHLGKEQAAQLVDCKSPRDIWRQLQFTWENDSSANWFLLFKRWVNLQMKPNQKLEDFLRESEKCYIQLKAIGHVYDDDFRRMLLLSNLNKEYQTDSKLYMEMGRPYQVVVANLRQTASQLEASKSSGGGTGTGGKPQANGVKVKPKQPNAGPVQNPRCFNCGEGGHITKDCPLGLERNKDGSLIPVCYKCKKKGHIKKECPSAPKPKETA